MTFPRRRIERIEDFVPFAPGTALEAMEVRVESGDDEHLAITMPVCERVRQPAGLLHGGMTVFLMESAASMHACWGIDLAERMPVGVEINATHLRAVSNGSVRAIARVVRRSRTMIVHLVEVYHVESGRLVSTGRATNYYVPSAKPEAQRERDTRHGSGSERA